ncbi:hypothetical protein ACT4ML_04735 [Natrinema sp. LN54]|uniref:hypothetical protein n=1 Tax=Natrinema sp. LN54 TaxID=3458705 RepID=UPI004035FC18
MDILQLLNQPWVGNLFVLLAALIGVGGSYAVYWKRRRDEIKNLRSALKAEIEQMSYLGQLPEDWESEGYIPRKNRIPAELVPPPEHISTTVYEENASELGYLSAEETEKIVEFYGNVSYLKSLMTIIRDEDPDSMHPHEALYGLLKRYSGMREDLIKMLDGELEPSEVEPTPVIRKLDGRVMATEETDTISEQDLKNRTAEHR